MICSLAYQRPRALNGLEGRKDASISHMFGGTDASTSRKS